MGQMNTLYYLYPMTRHSGGLIISLWLQIIDYAGGSKNMDAERQE